MADVKAQLSEMTWTDWTQSSHFPIQQMIWLFLLGLLVMYLLRILGWLGMRKQVKRSSVEMMVHSKTPEGSLERNDKLEVSSKEVSVDDHMTPFVQSFNGNCEGTVQESPSEPSKMYFTQQPIGQAEGWNAWSVQFQGRVEADLKVSSNFLESLDLLTAHDVDVRFNKKSDKGLRSREIRVLEVLTSCNRALTQANTETELLEMVCQSLVNVGKYDFAWIGLAERDQDKTLKPMAQAGKGQIYTRLMPISWGESEVGPSPIGRAIRTGQVQLIQRPGGDPQFALGFDQAGSDSLSTEIVLPLTVDGQVCGAIHIGSNQIDSFDELEKTMLTNMAGDIAFGLNALKIRIERDKTLNSHHLSVYCKLLPVENITKMRTDGVGWDRSRNWRKK
jgi:putative methionine-R-sulfoxide reductase with GAF domain